MTKNKKGRDSMIELLEATSYTDAIEENCSASEKDALVDSNLTPEARDARNFATMSALHPDGVRAVATFLGCKDYLLSIIFGGKSRLHLPVNSTIPYAYSKSRSPPAGTGTSCLQ
jgi:hypothetical protein